MTQIDHIVFDIGRVLIHWDASLVYRELIPNAEERDHFLENICSPEWNLEQDRGRAWRVAEDLLIDEYPDKEHLIRAYRGRWIESVPHAYGDVVEVLKGLLRDGRDVTLLTNFSQDTYVEAENEYVFLKEPRGVTVSGRIGLIKPDNAIFEHHAQTFDLEPQRTVFIDDSEKNVLAARESGWQGIHFAGIEGAAKLARELQTLGVGV